MRSLAAPVRSVTIAAALVAWLWVPGLAAAIETETFAFEPWPASVAGSPRGRFDVRVPAGAEASEQARLSNRTGQPRRFRLYGADVSTDPATGELTTSAATATPTGVGSWIVLDDEHREVVLGAHESIVIDFVIDRPADAAAGGTGAVVAEEVEATGAGSGISVRYRIALRIDATDGSGGPGVFVEQLALDVPLQVLPRTGTVTAVVRNRQADTVTPRVQLHVDRGGRRYVVLQEQVTLRAGDEARFEVDWLSVPATGGAMTPGVELAWDGGDLRVDGGRELVVPGWLPALLVLLSGWLLYRHGRGPVAGQPPSAATDVTPGGGRGAYPR